MQKNSRIFEIGVSIFLLLVSLYMLFFVAVGGSPTNDGNLSAMAFPRAVYIAMAVGCAYLAVNGIVKLKKEKHMTEANTANPEDGAEVPEEQKNSRKEIVPKKSLVTFLLIIAYAALWNVIGFSLSTFLFFLAEAWFLDRKRPFWVTLLLAVVITAIMYAVFGMLFKVSFPEPILDMLTGV